MEQKYLNGRIHELPYKPEGITVLVNITGISKEDLTDALLWKGIFLNLVEVLGLNPFPETFTVKRFRDSDNEVCGITFCMVLSESHIAGHTWGECEYMRLELSSCKPINAEVIKTYLIKRFKESQVEYRTVDW